MVHFRVMVAAVLLAGLLWGAAEAQDCASGQCGTSVRYAAQMNSGGFFRHDRGWGGAEVIFKTTGTATEAQARQWWLNSPPHRKLLLSGAIQDVACVGGVCVGRSVQAVQNTVTKPFMQGIRTGLQPVAKRTPLKRIRNHFHRCR
jgi:hypothetical protein